MKKITMTLDASSISSAIKEIEAYKAEFQRKLTAFVQALTDRGAEIAVKQIVSLGAVETGELSSSIQIMYVEGNKGIIFSDCPYATFVELGTGIIGAGSPHPTKPWDYDVNSHGEYGWLYYDEKQNRYRWTKGMPSRPFFYNTIQELYGEAGKIAKNIFG